MAEVSSSPPSDTRISVRSPTKGRSEHSPLVKERRECGCESPLCELGLRLISASRSLELIALITW